MANATPTEPKDFSIEEEHQRMMSSFAQNMISIPAEAFLMGATKSEMRQCGRVGHEFPLHQVTLSAFAISAYPVTQAQWEAVMGNNPSRFKSADRPVENVSWNDCQEFIATLNATSLQSSLNQGGQWGDFRLPTEAEWECACRAGTQTIWPFGNDPEPIGQYAWFNGNAGNQTHPVGKFLPNAWGAYDMLGNVWEWCADWFDEKYYASSPMKNPQGPSSGQTRALRGGAWNNYPNICRSASRNKLAPHIGSYLIGFRLARSVA